MLEQLKLSNLALSVQAEVDFTPGMICITGETGAGKSLVVDALGLVLGARPMPIWCAKVKDNWKSQAYFP